VTGENGQNPGIAITSSHLGATEYSLPHEITYCYLTSDTGEQTPS